MRQSLPSRVVGLPQGRASLRRPAQSKSRGPRRQRPVNSGPAPAGEEAARPDWAGHAGPRRAPAAGPLCPPPPGGSLSTAATRRASPGKSSKAGRPSTKSSTDRAGSACHQCDGSSVDVRPIAVSNRPARSRPARLRCPPPGLPGSRALRPVAARPRRLAPLAQRPAPRGTVSDAGSRPAPSPQKKTAMRNSPRDDGSRRTASPTSKIPPTMLSQRRTSSDGRSASARKTPSR